MFQPILSLHPSTSLHNLNLVKTYNTKRLHGSIWHGDALAFLRSLKTQSANVVFLDPPFNLGKDYGVEELSHDKRDGADYTTWFEEILTECIRVMAPGAALYLYHLPNWGIQFGGYLSRYLTFRHWIAISMKNGFVRGRRLYPAHYALLYFTKGSQGVFKRPKLAPVKCRHCGDLIKDYGGYRSIIERKGINLSDVWDDLSPVRHRGRKHRKGNELPPKLLERVISISGRKGSLYVDPFAGTGTGVAVAAKAGMLFAACDLIGANCNVIAERLGDPPTPSSS